MKHILTIVLLAFILAACTKLDGEKVSILTDKDIENIVESIKANVPVDEHAH